MGVKAAGFVDKNELTLIFYDLYGLTEEEIKIVKEATG